MEENYGYIIRENEMLTILTRTWHSFVNVIYEHSRIEVEIMNKGGEPYIEDKEKIIKLLKKFGFEKDYNVQYINSQSYKCYLGKNLTTEERVEFNELFLSCLKELGIEPKKWN